MSPYRRHTPPEASEALARLAVALEVYRARRLELAAEFANSVRECIEAKATWGEIGRVVGLSKQAARAHWGPFLQHDASLPRGGRFLDRSQYGPSRNESEAHEASFRERSGGLESALE